MSAARASDPVGQALFALVAAIRDELPLEPEHVDELLDLQPTNEAAKALLCGLASRGIVNSQTAGTIMIERDLEAI